MPLDTYANLQASILSWLARPGDPLVSPSIPDIIELFEREATRRLKVGGAEKRASLTALSAAVALPADFGELRLATSGGVILTYVTPMQLPPGDGPPAHYTIVGNEMRLGPSPSPSGGCTVEIVYQSGVPPLSDTNTTNWLLAAHPDCYLFGSLVEAESFIGSDERVPLWAQRREAAFASIETADRKARWGGAPLSIRAEGVSGGNGTAAGDWTSAPPVPIPIVSIVAGDGLTGGGTEGIVTIALDAPVDVAHGGTGNTSFGVDRVLTGGGPGVQASPATVSSAGDVLAISYTTDGAGDLGGYWWHDDSADPLWWAWYSSADTARLGRWNGTSTFLGDALTVEHTTGVVSLPNGATAPTPAPGDNDTSVATTAFVQAALAAGGSGINQLTGDVTAGPGSGSQAAAIATNAVTTAKIAAANVTYAKVQNVVAARLLGNPTGSAAAPSEISLGTNLSFAGTVLNAAAGATGLSGMTAGQIPIAATATTVTSSGNLSGAVTTSGSLATTLAANAVATANITNANVTYAKIQNVAANSILGNATGSAAAPAEIALPLAVANGGTGVATAAAAPWVETAGDTMTAMLTITAQPTALTLDTPSVNQASQMWFNDGGNQRWLFYTKPDATHDFVLYNPGKGDVAKFATASGNATIVGTVTANGTLLTSDADLKTDIEPLGEALPLVARVEPVTFRWLDGDDTRHSGFLAQDMAGIEVPGIVEGKPGDGLAVDVGAILAVLWQAVRELSAQVTALEAGK